jgi:DNA-directed RNA polymerase specialized sigma24 family protein
MADRCEVLIKRESLDELEQAVRSAPMESRTRQVFECRMAGMPGKEIGRRVRASSAGVYVLLRKARGAVRQRLGELRSGK